MTNGAGGPAPRFVFKCEKRAVEINRFRMWLLRSCAVSAIQALLNTIPESYSALFTHIPQRPGPVSEAFGPGDPTRGVFPEHLASGLRKPILPGLDAIRTIAVLLVVLYHSGLPLNG